MGGVDPIDQNISACKIGHAKKKWLANFPFLSWFVSQWCLSFLSWFVSQWCLSDWLLSINICWGKNLICYVSREALWIFMTTLTKNRKSANTFTARRRSIKVSSDVRYDNKTHWIGKGNLRRCSCCRKTTKHRSSHRRCSAKNVFSEILQHSQENTCVRVSFLITLQASRRFPANFAKFSRTPFLPEHLWWLLLKLLLCKM